MPASLHIFFIANRASPASASSPRSHGPTIEKRGDDDAHTFEITVEFILSKAKRVDGGMQVFERDTIVKWEANFVEIDPQDIQSMEEQAVKNLVEKIEESIGWGPEQEVSLSKFDDWKGEYVRIEDG
jgi:hypothetical protein